MADNRGKMDPTFNSGKMQHLFKQDGEWMYITNEPSCTEAVEAMRKGVAYLKVDGSNGAVEIDADGKIRCWQRFMDSKGTVSPDDWRYRPLLQGENPPEFSGRTYYLESRDLDILTKGQRKIWTQVHDSVQRALDRGDVERGRYYSAEFVGQKFNNTPCVAEPVGVCLHTQQKLSDLRRLQPMLQGPRASRASADDTHAEAKTESCGEVSQHASSLSSTLTSPSLSASRTEPHQANLRSSDAVPPKFECPRSFEEFEKFFATFAIEGLVIEHKARWWKVKSEHFRACRDTPSGWLALVQLWKNGPPKPGGAAKGKGGRPRRGKWRGKKGKGHENITSEPPAATNGTTSANIPSWPSLNQNGSDRAGTSSAALETESKGSDQGSQRGGVSSSPQPNGVLSGSNESKAVEKSLPESSTPASSKANDAESKHSSLSPADSSSSTSEAKQNVSDARDTTGADISQKSLKAIWRESRRAPGFRVIAPRLLGEN